MTYIPKTEAEFLKLIRGFRKSKKLSIKQAAEAIGISEYNLGEKERGIKSIKANELIRIAESYGYEIEISFYGEEQNVSNEAELVECVRAIRKKKSLYLDTASAAVNICVPSLVNKEKLKTHFRMDELFGLAKLCRFEIRFVERESEQ